ncbi:Homeobox and leucine zipper protein Homez [Nibea albiflora]|uniref:Homeobox and leucine zipper protein Homez n=1 Tax=Nibea albiflora TaxID=240163 RepID=A0ACB7EV41_NIBAL|nr:Homeobox and leucine zipper protein Homez [Nibea albiflora]
MMQTADEGLPMFSQETPDAPGDTPTLSEINIAPAMTCDLYQNSVVCLPVVSDSTRVIWINFNQTSLQLDSAIELQLDKAFDSFPYLTQDQTAALAQRCSLHPDQVKVWFMVQRLRYGISWDYKDIRDVRKKIKSGWGKKELRKDEGGKKKRSGRKKGRKVREEQSAKEGSTMGENMTTYQQEKPMKKENDSKLETTPFSRKAKASKGLLSTQDWLAHKSLAVPDEARDAPPLSSQAVNVPQVTDIQTPNMESGLKEKAELELKLKGEAESADHSGVKVMELAEMTTPVASDRRLRSHWNTKTHAQLTMMKEAFSRCQYPDSKDYDQLSVLTGVSRHTLVQWYGDMRYYIKERKPGWMTEEQHRQALANIRYRQYLKMLGKMDGGDKNTSKTELDKGERCGKYEDVQLPPE